MDSMSKRCRQASKASKTRILDEVCAATHLNRKYAITRINLIEISRPASRSPDPSEEGPVVRPGRAQNDRGGLGRGWLSLNGQVKGHPSSVAADDPEALWDDPGR